MTETKMLIGSLSNDLFRIANLLHRDSDKAALRFAQEAKRWIDDLKGRKVRFYIKGVIAYVDEILSGEIDKDNSEDLLMYGILLQNYTLKIE